ncbi:MAG: B12-binding domain-containing radical SAM protein [Firmicutes bacterium]|nr:B12-binding domain-containing radical SAM protein [Bacillota bacterium]
MRYEGDIYRPPSEAYSYILQATIGCAHNKCTFCTSFKAKKFRIRPLAEVFEDLEMARRYYRHIEKIFIADGDALVCKNDYLMAILDKIKELFPECQRVSIYGRAKDILRKTEEELIALRDNGLGIIYMGVESGNPVILERIKKGETREEMIEAVRKAEGLGIPTSLTFLSGIGGRAMWRENAIDTGTIISEMEPTYASFLTVMVVPGTPLHDEMMRGEFELLRPDEVLKEAQLLLENINVKKTCIFRSNHASNYVSLKGDLPQDREAMIERLKVAQNNSSMWKDERFRML